MALLQIAEPGQSEAPHQHKLAVGIDLGTTNSLVAAVRSGSADVLADQRGQRSVPSVVAYLSESEPLIGIDAHNSDADSRSVVRSAKRLMGKGAKDLDGSWLADHYDFDVSSGPLPAFVTQDGNKTAIDVSADILSTLKATAEQTLGGDLIGAVVTVPAYFDDAQRQATKDAAALAGLNVLRLINEPTAAAVAYGLDNEEEGIVAIYDLGGGTFDVSLLKMQRGIFEVLATAGDTSLGGDDIDNALVHWLMQQVGVEKLEDEQARADAKRYARVLKEALSDHKSVDVEFSVGGSPIFTGQLSLDTYNTIITPLIARTLKPCRRVLRDADVEIDDLRAVVMVGGSTRIPLVRTKVGEFFNMPVLTSINPDEVVAVGAAIQADMLVGNKSDNDLLLLDVTPLSLGLEIMGGMVEKVIPRNTTIPITRGQEFTTYKDGQSAMSLHVLQGERELVDDCRSLARFELKGFPAKVAGSARIQVMFQVDADGLLTVSALEKQSGVVASVDVRPSYGLNDGEIEQMLREAMDNAGEDMQKRLLQEQKVEASRVIEAINSALNADGNVHLSTQEYASIQTMIEQLEAANQGDNRDTIKQAVEKLERGSSEFVERRMNATVKRMMQGQGIDDIDKASISRKEQNAD